MKYLILLIAVLTIILYFVYKDYLKILKITSLVTISSGFLTFVVGYLVKFLLSKNLSFINISKIIKILIPKFVFNGISLLIIGLIEIFCYFTISYALTKKKVVNNS